MLTVYATRFPYISVRKYISVARRHFAMNSDKLCFAGGKILVKTIVTPHEI